MFPFFKSTLKPHFEKLRLEIVQNIPKSSLLLPRKTLKFYYVATTDKKKWFRKDLHSSGSARLFLNLSSCFKVEKLLVAPDEDKVAYIALDPGQEQGSLHVRAIGTLRDSVVDWKIKNAFNFAWSPCSRHLFFTRLDAKLHSSRVYLFDVQTARERLVHEETDPTLFVDVSLSKDSRSVFITSSSRNSSTVHVVGLDADGNMDFVPRLLLYPTPGVVFNVERYNGLFHVYFNDPLDVDLKFLALVNPNTAEPAHCSDLTIHYSTRRVVTDIEVMDSYAVLLTKKDTVAHIVVLDLLSGEEREIRFPEDGAVLFALPQPQGPDGKDRFYFEYSTPLVAKNECWLDCATLQLYYPTKTPATQLDLQVTCEWAKNPHDGTMVPMTLIRQSSV
ncbi:hypothetical protein HDU91_002442, partial [Kappamyces sp. JEL0680]